VIGDEQAGERTWRNVPGSAAWGVNALLSAGGTLYVASLRGAARLDGERLIPLPGPGAAFSLAATPDGVAIGYGQGVLLPQSRLLSAFHGLPGNQALALVWADALYVGTPSGLGAVREGRVLWRLGQGDGRLPHPWITALLTSEQGLVIGTYGGGIARVPAARQGGVPRVERLVETEGLKVNAGCLVSAGGRLYAGMDGRGLWRSSADGRRFERLDLALPSPRITALLPIADGLLVGTDQGVALVPLASNEMTP
jgi:ligand-binding sensor domain-containing protein